MIRLALSIVAVAVCFGPSADADLVFVSDAYFAPGNGPQTSGAGVFTVEHAPVGSGVQLLAPEDLPAGFATGRDFIISYIVDQSDIGGSVVINWTADRLYSSSGELASAVIDVSFSIELANSQGNSARVLYEALSGTQSIGPASYALIFSPAQITLTENEPILDVTGQVIGPTFELPISDAFRQNFGIVLIPTVAGQEFRIYLSGETGITSTLSLREAAVPEPSSVVLAGLGFLGLVVFARTKR